MTASSFHEKLKFKMDDFVHLIYGLTKKFPQEELYGIVSQSRRAALSIILNYIEGYARKKKLVLINFLEISYGSLKECKYLLYFSFKEGYLKEKEYQEAINLAEEIGAMLWKTIKNLEKQ
jgi:four helix bundle protein